MNLHKWISDLHKFLIEPAAIFYNYDAINKSQFVN